MLNPDERLQLENAVLSGMLNYETFFLSVYDFNPNKTDLFSNTNNRIIYEIIINYFVEKGYPTLPEIYHQLILDNTSDEVKNHFTKNVAASEIITNLDAVLALLEDSVKHVTKQAINRIEKRNLPGLEYSQTLRDELDKIILEKFENYKRDTRTNEQKVTDLLNGIQKVREGKNSDYIPTGFSKLDNAIIGIPRGHLTTIAARPSMGKTSFMLQLKRNLVAEGYKPLIISIEMTSDQLLIKDISAYSKIDSRKIESGQINDEENEKITEASNLLKEDNYFIEDDSSWTVEKIKSTIRRYLIKEKIDIVFLDYLTLVRIANKKDRYDLAIGEVTNSLRELAKETGLPIVILSQLNRAVESRTDKKPILSDLRESGSIEQDSKTVLFLYRPDYYGINLPDKANELVTAEGNSVEKKEYCEVIISKCRNGQTGIVPLRYRKEIHLFESLYQKGNKHVSTQYENQGENWWERKIETI